MSETKHLPFKTEPGGVGAVAPDQVVSVPARSTRSITDPTLPHRSDEGTAVALEELDDVDLEPGDRLDDYVLQERLGEGAVGVVYKARDEQLDRDVALKVLRGAAGTSDDAARIATEARAMAQLRDENVAAVFAARTCRGHTYIVMELIDGPDLASWLKLQGPLPVDVALGILRQICRGVSAMHGRGIVHFDLKPSNILIDRDLRVAITDFGMARLLQRDPLTMLGGTPYYIAPEVAAGTVTTEHASIADLYALGLIAMELLTGKHALPTTAGQEAMMRCKMSSLVRVPSDVRAELGDAFDAPVRRALQVDPAERFPTANALWKAFVAARAASVPELAPRVLIVDDDAEFRSFAQGVVSQSNPSASIHCTDGGASTHAEMEAWRCDLVLLDLQMPDNNGFELLAELRTMCEEQERPVPLVLVVSGAASVADWRLMSQLGAAAFLVKPVSAGHLGRVVQQLLGGAMPARPGPRSAHEAAAS